MALSPERRAAHDRAALALSRLDDDALAARLAGATPAGAGIGGRVALLEADGVPVFAKHVPLTAPELAPGAWRSTADVFGLPPACHYGAPGTGGPGFGAWRELAAHELTTAAALDGEHPVFPLLHHWRVLPEPIAHRPPEHARPEAMVASWGGSPGVRLRLDALAAADTSLVLLLERIPANLHDWLTDRVAEGGPDLDAALERVERGLLALLDGVDALRLRHFDGHFGNVLTDGRELYLTDFGLSAGLDWDLAPDEAAFVTADGGAYDRCRLLGHYVIWLLYAYGLTDKAERSAAVRAIAAGGPPPATLPRAAARIVTRYAPVAEVMDTFMTSFATDRTTPFPPDALRLFDGR